MKSSLLLWDRVEYIAPNERHKPQYADAELAEAGELLAEAYIPSEEDRSSVGETVRSLLDKAPPDWLLFGRSTSTIDNELFHIYRDKFSEDLIRALADRHLAIFPVNDPHDFSTHTSLGLILMGVLAQRCAGTQKELMTDRTEQYEALAKSLTFKTGGVWHEAESSVHERAIETALVTASLKVIDPRGISFRQLLDLRKNETRYEGSFRQSYSSMIRDYAKKISEAATSVDRVAIEKSFEFDMQQKLAELKERLRDRAGHVLLSQEMFVTVLATALGQLDLISSGGPLIAGIFGVGALGKVWKEYRTDRNSILAENPMGYLYKSKTFPRY